MTWDARSVDTAHAVDRDLLDQKFLGGKRLCLVVICGGGRNGDVFGHGYLLLRGAGCHRNGTECHRSRLTGGAGRRMANGRSAVISEAVVKDVSSAG